MKVQKHRAVWVLLYLRSFRNTYQNPIKGWLDSETTKIGRNPAVGRRQAYLNVFKTICKIVELQYFNRKKSQGSMACGWIKPVTWSGESEQS